MVLTVSRKEEDGSTRPAFAPLRQAMLAAEALLRGNAAFMAATEPVRYRTSLSAGPFEESGARLHIKAVAERKQDGTRVWQGTTGCEVIRRSGRRIPRLADRLTTAPPTFSIKWVSRFRWE